MNRYVIKSVLGFDLKVDIKDQEGNLLLTGVKRTVFPKYPAEEVTVRLFDRTFFTSFNEELLAKIRQHRRLND